MLRLNFNYPTIHFSSDRCSEKRAKEKKAYAPNGDVMQEKKNSTCEGMIGICLEENIII